MAVTSTTKTVFNLYDSSNEKMRVQFFKKQESDNTLLEFKDDNKKAIAIIPTRDYRVFLMGSDDLLPGSLEGKIIGQSSKASVKFELTELEINYTNTRRLPDNYAVNDKLYKLLFNEETQPTSSLLEKFQERELCAFQLKIAERVLNTSFSETVFLFFLPGGRLKWDSVFTPAQLQKVFSNFSSPLKKTDETSMEMEKVDVIDESSSDTTSEDASEIESAEGLQDAGLSHKPEGKKKIFIDQVKFNIALCQNRSQRQWSEYAPMKIILTHTKEKSQRLLIGTGTTVAISITAEEYRMCIEQGPDGKQLRFFKNEELEGKMIAIGGKEQVGFTLTTRKKVRSCRPSIFSPLRAAKTNAACYFVEFNKKDAETYLKSKENKEFTCQIQMPGRNILFQANDIQFRLFGNGGFKSSGFLSPSEIEKAFSKKSSKKEEESSGDTTEEESLER